MMGSRGHVCEVVVTDNFVDTGVPVSVIDDGKPRPYVCVCNATNLVSDNVVDTGIAVSVIDDGKPRPRL